MKKLSDLLALAAPVKAVESVETEPVAAEESVIVELSKETGMTVEAACEAVEDNSKDIQAIIDTYNTHKKKAEELKAIVEKFVAETKQAEVENKEEATANEDPLAAIGVTKESHPEVFGEWKYNIVNPDAEIPFGVENKAESHKLFEDIVNS